MFTKTTEQYQMVIDNASRAADTVAALLDYEDQMIIEGASRAMPVVIRIAQEEADREWEEYLSSLLYEDEDEVEVEDNFTADIRTFQAQQGWFSRLMWVLRTI